MTDDTWVSLGQLRSELLDLTSRNPLIHRPLGSKRGKALELNNLDGDALISALVIEVQAVELLPLGERVDDSNGAVATDSAPEPSLAAESPEPHDAASPTSRRTGARGPDVHRPDHSIPTSLRPDALEKKLLALLHAARTLEEDQGTSDLYLACGFLRWFEAGPARVERFAPLLLIPVRLERNAFSGKVLLTVGSDEITANLSLQNRLRVDFRIQLPDVEDSESLSPSRYFEAVRSALAEQDDWDIVEDRGLLGFFSFSKFLMYRDLDPEAWRAASRSQGSPILSGLLGEGFPPEPPVLPSEGNLDSVLSPAERFHVVDADSSQTTIIEEVKAGRNVVIQGPPGTGKSQTITNLIASAIRQGKRVLFVAEKMAALDVVRQRMDRIGLGETCLELHSRHANKKDFLAALHRTLETHPPSPIENGAFERLHDVQDTLNTHAHAMHSPLDPSGRTPYQILAELIRHAARSTPVATLDIGVTTTWAFEEYAHRRHQLVQLCRRLSACSTPARHPWRGVQVDSILPGEVERSRLELEQLVTRLRELDHSGRQLADLLGSEEAPSLQSLAGIIQRGKELAAGSPRDLTMFRDPVWSSSQGEIESLVSAGERLDRALCALEGRIDPNAWKVGVVWIRKVLAQKPRSVFPRLNREARQAVQAMKQITGAKRSDWPQILDELIAGQQALALIEASDSLGQAAFRERWQGWRSPWNHLREILNWVGDRRQRRRSDVRSLSVRFDDTEAVETHFGALDAKFRALVEPLQGFLSRLQLDEADVFPKPLPALAATELLSLLQEWIQDLDLLPEWTRVRGALNDLQRLGLDDLVEKLFSGELAPEEAPETFDRVYHELLIRAVYEQRPELARFEGRTHEQIVEEFRELDLRGFEVARNEVARLHCGRLPHGDVDTAELSLLRMEIRKKRAHKPIRRLIQDAGHTIQSIKPVFMMSPLSVAQFLPPGALEFDLLLIDEASQIPPVDALGAILRSRQVVVVGDEKQLPPTSFFERVLEDDEDEEADATAKDLESILGLCLAMGIPSRMLRWHYRSRHESLIAVSNREFYDDSLHVIPSCHARSEDLGLLFHFVPDGVFERGTRKANRVEAALVARAAVEHARGQPELSLGIGTFSQRQRDAIQAELDRLWQTEPDVREFLTDPREEPFFVKNLENLQGDERDVIFISVGYGPDSEGTTSMNFGPLSREGGERRLNVLISRARSRCEVFSSLRGSDIDLERARSQGARALKVFLDYAEHGRLAGDLPTSRDFETPFEEDVALALSQAGYRVASQVGLAGFFIDLGVVDPQRRGRYLLGIECDGATYHLCRSARERDRLRPAVLEARGWSLHHIWSTDWFQRRDHELRRLLEAVEDAKRMAAHPARSPDIELAGTDDGSREVLELATPDWSSTPLIGPGAFGPEPLTVDQETAPRAAPWSASIESEPYIESSFEVGHTWMEIHEAPTGELADIVAEVVRIEGPIHAAEIARRVTSLCGRPKTGPRIQEAVSSAIEQAARVGRIQSDEDFFTAPGQARRIVRDRSNVSSASLTLPEMLPPAEIRAGIVSVLQSQGELGCDDLVREVSRAFGIRDTSAALRERIWSIAYSPLSGLAVSDDRVRLPKSRRTRSF